MENFPAGGRPVAASDAGVAFLVVKDAIYMEAAR